MKDIKIKTKPALKPSLLLRIENGLELLSKTSDELLQELEEKPNIKLTLKTRPKWFYKDFAEPQPKYLQSEIKKVEEQIFYEFDGLDKEIALEIVAHLDHRGFFVGDIEKIAKQYGVSKDYAEDIREFITREIEPLGVACKNLEEFILVQLEEFYPKEEDLHKEVIRLLRGESKDLKAKKILSTLKLRPFEGEEVIYKSGSVDMVFEYDGDQWYVFVMDDFWHVENYKTLAFILDLRRKVLRAVGNLIVERQGEFMLGKGPLKSLKLSQVAESLGISLSTVSRIVSNKYAKTPVGIYSLRFFFQRETKGGYSKEEILKILKAVIEKEGKGKSDSELASILQKRGIKIARRTVNNYRRILEGKA